MDDERFAYDPQDEKTIVRAHNDRIATASEVTDALEEDAFQVLLANANRLAERLRASNDTRAIQASTANTKMFMDALKGHL